MDAVSRPVEPGDAGYQPHPNQVIMLSSVIPDSRYSGYVIEHQNVRVKFDRHKDAMIVLNQYPEAKIVV